MRLTPSEFDARFNAGELRLSFIGMSNIGKSYTAMRLRKSHGFKLYEVDEAIQHALNLKSMQESADWMGFPYEDSYPAREAEYLALESQLTAAAFDDAARDSDNGNMILDTTGSVIYTSKKCQGVLKDRSIIVHIQAAEENLVRLEALYSMAPKPLIWAGRYKPDNHESTQDNLKRCYPDLLKSRLGAYNALADVTIPASLLFNDETTADSLFEMIRTSGKDAD